MKPVIYIMAAILATLAGFMVVSWNIEDRSVQKEVPTKKTQEKPIKTAKKPDDVDKVKENKFKAPSLTSNSLKGLNKGHMTTFVIRQKPRDIPEFEFQDISGTKKTLADWKGKVVLLNLWATWCAPCRKEMPAFDNLKHQLDKENFDLVTISIDRGGIEKPQKFFKEIKIKHLELYHDKTARLNAKLNAFGMPTTLLINKEGKEIGRLVGPAEWDSSDALTLLKAAINK